MRLAPRLVFATKLALRPYLLLYILLMLAAAVPFATKSKCEWELVFVTTSHRLLAGEDIYVPFTAGYVYPPLQSLIAIPVLDLAPLASRLAWFAVNAVALWCVLRSAWRLAGGPDLENKNTSRREHLAAGLGLFVGLTYFLNALLHHQTDILLAWLLFAGCEALQKNRGLTAAALFGIAAAMKCTPLLFAPYLLYRRRPLAAGVVLAVAVAASLLPDLIHSPTDASTWLSKWYRIFLAPMLGAEHRPGVWASDILFNQSLIGAINRWSLTSWAIDGKFQTFLVAPRLSPTEMKSAILVLAAGIGAVSLLALRRSLSLPWECSLVLCGMLLFSPMSSAAHFGVLMLPACLLARAAVLDRSRLAVVLLAGMMIAAYASNKDLLGAKLYSIGLWYGIVMAGAAIALAASWLGLRNASTIEPPVGRGLETDQ